MSPGPDRGRKAAAAQSQPAQRGESLATGALTGGKFGLYRWEIEAGQSGPDPHFHRSLTGPFYILEGTVAIFDGRQWTDTKPGDWVHVPKPR